MTTKKTGKWKVLASALCAATVLMAILIFPTQAVMNVNAGPGTSSSSSSTAAPAAPAGVDSTAFWMDKHYEMYYTTAKTVRANADEQDFTHVPHYIFDFLTANPSMTLRVQYKGEVYVLNDKNMQKYGVASGTDYLFSSLDAMGF